MTSESKVRDLVITGISTKFPDRYLSHYINNKSSNPSSTNEHNQSSGCFFDPHCPECIRELWGPLLSPFAYLIKQNAQYFNEILTRVGQSKVNTKSNSSSSSSKRHVLKPPKLEYEDHKFLTSIGQFALYTTKISWLITWTLGFLLLILALIMILLSDSSLPPLIVILRMSEASEWGMKFTLQIVFIIISIIGIGKMLASILGLFGTTHRTGSLILGTIIFMGVLILFEIAAIAYCAITWSDLIEGAELALNTSFESFYGGADDNGVTNAWDRIFQNYECCGWASNDFTITPMNPLSSSTIPYSCCRPGAPHPNCESTTASSNENYADEICYDAIQEKVYSTLNIIIGLSALGIIIFVEIVSAVVTYLYSSGLKTAGRQRRRRNEKLLNKFQSRLASYTDETTDHKPPDVNEILPQNEQTEFDDLRQLYNQYSAFHQTPPDMDPSLMSITPTVIQVKRPDVYSYFYYE